VSEMAASSMDLTICRHKSVPQVAGERRAVRGFAGHAFINPLRKGAAPAQVSFFFWARHTKILKSQYLVQLCCKSICTER
jgi:hypothetical protein